MSRVELLIGASAAAMALVASSAAAAGTGPSAQPSPPPPPMYAPPAPPLPPAAAFPRRAMLRIGFISEEDYPVSALREEAQGDTTIRYVIGVGGRVESCELVQSSGHEDLDWTSCAIVTQRFVFMPALDEKGHPVPESRQQRIRWVLPDTQPVCKAEEVNCVPVPPRFVGPPAPPPPPAPFGPLVPLIAPPAPMRAAPPFSPPPWRSAPEVAPPAPPKAAQKPRPPR